MGQSKTTSFFSCTVCKLAFQIEELNKFLSSSSNSIDSVSTSSRALVVQFLTFRCFCTFCPVNGFESHIHLFLTSKGSADRQLYTSSHHRLQNVGSHSPTIFVELVKSPKQPQKTISAVSSQEMLDRSHGDTTKEANLLH